MTQTSSVPEMSPRRVSNSEVSAWNTCERKYFYEYDMRLAPVKLSDALSRGILGHEILADYYESRKAGVPHDEAVRSARGRLQRSLAESGDFETVSDVDRILQGYWSYYGEEKLDILAVEKAYDIPLTPEATYVMRLDLLVRNLTTGAVELRDFKFVYDFWNYDKVNLSGQFPKYVGALRFTGQVVDKAVLDQLRYRKLKNPSVSDLYTRIEATPSEAKIKRALKEQIMATQEIIAWREQPLEVRKDRARRVLNPTICNFCNFKNLCMAEFDGNDLRFLMQGEYKINEQYGYNDEAVY